MIIENIDWEIWPPSPNCTLELIDSKITCFKIDLKALSESNYGDLKKALRDEEIEKMNAYKKQSDRNLYLVAHGAFNLITKEITGILPNINYTPYGKPYIENSEIEFNITHSGELVLIALSKESPIGVDIEQVLPIENKSGLLEQFFHIHEIEEIRGLSPPNSDLAFYSCWTRKEAILKSLGNGLSIDTNSFYAGSFVTSNTAQPKSPPGYPADWKIWDFMIESNYIACIASPKNSPQPIFYTVSVNILCS